MGSDLLFARPSLISGIARTFDLFGVFDFYNISPSGDIADARALYSDWSAVGDDLRKAMKSTDCSAGRQLSLFEDGQKAQPEHSR